MEFMVFVLVCKCEYDASNTAMTSTQFTLIQVAFCHINIRPVSTFEWKITGTHVSGPLGLGQNKTKIMKSVS